MPVSSAPSFPSAWQLPVVDTAVARSSPVLWLPITGVQEGPVVWDIAPGREGLARPQQLRLNVSGGILFLLHLHQAGRVREARGWSMELLHTHPRLQVLWVAPPWSTAQNKKVVKQTNTSVCFKPGAEKDLTRSRVTTDQQQGR